MTNKGAQTSAQCASKNSFKKVLRPQEVLFLYYQFQIKLFFSSHNLKTFLIFHLTFSAMFQFFVRLLERGEQTGLDTLVVHAVNDEY